jgi:hypothetical protein
MLLKWSRIRDVFSSIIEEAAAIVDAPGDLPLAIAIVGFYISSTRRDLSEILQSLGGNYRQRKKILYRKASLLVHQYHRSVLTTWESSLTAAVRQFHGASALLDQLASMQHEKIPGNLLRLSCTLPSGTETQTFRIRCITVTTATLAHEDLCEALDALETFFLVRRRYTQDNYHMHRLVHQWSHDRSEDVDRDKLESMPLDS